MKTCVPAATPLRTSSTALIVLSGVAFLFPAPADAQYFGRNKVQYETFDFDVLRTPHFDIHFYPEEAEAVEDMARMSERWYERFARNFQHEFEERKPLILYADHPDFQQTNTLRGAIGEGTGGVTESLKNRVIMPLTGSYADNDHVLGHELVHAFQYNLAQSRSGTGIRGLSRLPLWLVEGMAEYLSVGREDPLTAMWLRDAVRRDDLPTIEQMTQGTTYFPYRFGQALWAYIGGTYGDQAVIDLYRSSLRGGWEPSIRNVLGISSDTLSVRWRESVEDLYEPLLEDRTPPEEAGTVLLAPETGAGQQNVSPSLSPDGRYVAFLSEKDLFSIDLFLADARTGEIVRTLSSAASDPHFDALRFIDSSVTWSPDASRLAFVVFADGDNQLVTVSTEDGDVIRRYSVPEVGAIQNPAWSPDGSSIVFTGIHGGVSDLFVLDMESGDVTQLTDDRHADFQPSWSPDGDAVVFSSDRGPETDFDRLTYSEFQLAFLDLTTGEVSHLPVFGDVRHSEPQFSPDGESLYFVSDQDGFSDIYRLRLATGEVFRVTRVATGVSGITPMSPSMSVASGTGTLAFSLFNEREFHIYTLDRQSAESDQVTVAQTDAAPGRLLPPPEPRDMSRVAAYLNDPLTGLPARGAYTAADAEEYDSDLSLDIVGTPSVGVGNDAFGTYAAGGAAAYFSDMLGDRQLGVSLIAQGTLKDIGGQVFYSNLKNRYNWGVGGGRTPYIWGFQTFGETEDGQAAYQQVIQRIYVDEAMGMVAYPFSRTRRIEAAGGFTRYSFDVERRNFLLNNQGFIIGQVNEDLETPPALNLGRGSVAFVHDNSFTGFTSPVRGARYRIEAGGYTGSVNFATALLDWRRYFNPTPALTFAVRGMHYGRYLGDASGNTEQLETETFFRPNFLGYETLIRGYAWESFSNGECTTNSVGSCAELDRLFGHRIGVANIEMRVPLTGTDRYGLFDFAYVPIDILAFADAGVAWDDSRPVDLSWSTTSAQRIPVFSAGVSSRINVLGALILEVYYAYPFQRPDKGWHWGFNLAPGW
ncbi:MAG: peptidase S9 [Gemmatimonadota bacterium]